MHPTSHVHDAHRQTYMRKHSTRTREPCHLMHGTSMKKQQQQKKVLFKKEHVVFVHSFLKRGERGNDTHMYLHTLR